MICFIRHSERLDSVDMQKWKKHERYNENEYDPVLSKNGKNIATNQLVKIMNDKYKGGHIDYIYSSPFSRCVETALQFKIYILKKYKKGCQNKN